MIIICENCSAKYMVSSSLLGEDGRNVKCAKCSKTWFAKPTQEEIVKAKEAVLPPEEDVQVDKKKLPTIVKEQIPKYLKIIPIILLFIILVISIIFYKNAVTFLFPPTQYLYELVGIYKTEDVSFRNFTIRKIKTKYGKDLLIRGQIHNNSSEERVVPIVRVLVYNMNGDLLLEHIIPSNGRILKPDDYQAVTTNIKNLHSLAEIIKIDIGNKLELYLR